MLSNPFNKNVDADKPSACSDKRREATEAGNWLPDLKNAPVQYPL